MMSVLNCFAGFFRFCAIVPDAGFGHVDEEAQ